MLIAFVWFSEMVWYVAEHLPEGLRSAKGEFQTSEVAFATAIFHSAFNLINVFALIWFVPQIAKVVRKWVPDDADGTERSRLRYISQNLVDLGELNLVEAESAIRRMSNNCDAMFKGAIDVFDHPKEDMSPLLEAGDRRNSCPDIPLSVRRGH